MGSQINIERKKEQFVLNSAQQQVVETAEGPVLVIAGPGSGKSMTLVERVVSLLSKGIEPQAIMVATFTEKAAKELMTRISNRLIESDSKINPNDLYIGTLHSLFLRFIEEYQEFSRIKRNYRLLDPFEQTFLVYNHISEFNKIGDIDEIINPNHHEYTNRWVAAQSLIKKINIVSEEALNIEQLLQSDEVSVKALGECYSLYQYILTEENALDFSTIQFEMLKMLQEHPNVLAEIQDTIKYFMIDEYQDTNTIQEKILLLLASRNSNICVVGDDDQGLYRFRGATIRNILKFADNFKTGTCKQIFLTKNYRSHPGIINFYNGFMKEQDWTKDGETFRFDKNIQPCEREFPDTASVVRLSTVRQMYSTSGEDDEYYHQEVLDFINYLTKNNIVTDYNQITFLYRSVRGREATALMEYLENHGIQVFSPRSDLFFNRPEIKLIIGAILAIFPQVLDGERESVISQKIQSEFRPFYEFFMQKVSKDPKANKQLIAWIIKHQQIHVNLRESTDYAFSQLIYQFFRFPIFAQYLDADLNGLKTDLRPAYNIGILLKLFSKFEYLYDLSIFTPEKLTWTLRHLFMQYLRFVIDGGMDEYEDFEEIVPSGCISFMTIHQSKGLEFPITIVGSMNAVPRKSYDTLDEILQNGFFSRMPYEPLEDVKMYDFYRLFYTAFSRAQNLLVLTGNEHDGHSALPSKVLQPYWKSIPSWRDRERFQPKLLNLAVVKKANIKHEYAFTSHILLYEACPLQYKFYKELEFTEVRQGGVIGGTLLHETIEDIHRVVFRGEENKLTDTNITAWFNANYNLLVKSEHGFISEAQRNSLLRQILRYRDANTGKWNFIKEAEVDVSLVRPDYILKGKIDLIRGENDTIDIVDFKSGDKPDVNTDDPIKRQILNQYRRQLEVYAYILEQRSGKKINKMHLYYPKEESGNPRISFKYNSLGVQATIQTFEDVVHKIENKDFSMDSHICHEKHCRECDLRHYCHKM